MEKTKLGLQEFLDYLNTQVKNGSIYLWGGQGETLEMLTDSYIRKKETSAVNAQNVIKLRNSRQAQYPNLRAFDCSGLIMYYLQNLKGVESDMTANSIMNKCTRISKSEIGPGTFCFRVYTSGADKGKAYHVGVVVDNSRTVIEAKGRTKGVVAGTMTSTWNAFANPPWFDLSAVSETEKESSDEYSFARNMKKLSPIMAGTDVRNLQKLLIAKGYSCGTTGADGEFGSNTQSAVKAFQKANNLTVDGIAGKKTCLNLGGIWIGDFIVSRLIKQTSPRMSGSDVESIQLALLSRGYSVGSSGADGVYGPDTYNAIRSLQAADGLTVDGIVGEKTTANLGGTWNK